MDLEFPRGRGHQVEKSRKFQGVGRVTWSPLKWKIQGVGGQTGKTLHGGVWIFSRTTHCSLEEYRFSNMHILYFRRFIACLGYHTEESDCCNTWYVHFSTCLFISFRFVSQNTLGLKVNIYEANVVQSSIHGDRIVVKGKYVQTETCNWYLTAEIVLKARNNVQSNCIGTNKTHNSKHLSLIRFIQIPRFTTLPLTTHTVKICKLLSCRLSSSFITRSLARKGRILLSCNRYAYYLFCRTL